MRTKKLFRLVAGWIWHKNDQYHDDPIFVKRWMKCAKYELFVQYALKQHNIKFMNIELDCNGVRCNIWKWWKGRLINEFDLEIDYEILDLDYDFYCNENDYELSFDWDKESYKKYVDVYSEDQMLSK